MKYIIRRDNLAKRFRTKGEAFDVRGDGEVASEAQAEAEHEAYIRGD